ncbi:MAG TPA: stalk domain-containing protein [Caldisericia bacterium]|nr:stalk domain-containing protein [Caldisericia bacterium]HPF48333.1 stalk domain-containing protein [Caldisericia bacterium]HPI83488.1 stalk domain-containing protein [Caldisericia bacterium]HPQ92786.1 stalk domain-containing protein [Caldisericia bacterium]HRV74116.1 stalk domain-containing protein [Caldisericia bacterium]
MKRTKKIFAILVVIVLLSLVPSTALVMGVSAKVKRLTAWGMEKVAATATADLRNLVVQGSSSELVALQVNPSTLQVTKFTTIYKPGSLKGPSSAAGTITLKSEPRLPEYGDWVSVVASSGGKDYLLSIHVTGGGTKVAIIPDTTFDGVNVKWDLLWFDLTYTGDMFLGVAKGSVITPGKSGTCHALLTLGTDGKGLHFIHKPKWTGEKFEYSPSGAGDLIAPIGITKRTKRVFFKANVGDTDKHGIYSCNFDGSVYKLISSYDSKFTKTVSGNTSYSLDYVTDDGKYIVLNDTVYETNGATVLDGSTGTEIAQLSHKSTGVSVDGLYSFFSNDDGFGFEFTIGGEPFILIENDDADFPATTDLNNRKTNATPVGTVTISPFGFLGLSNTNITSTGQVYFVTVTSPPKPQKSLLIANPLIVDFGIIDENIYQTIDIENQSGARISGTAKIKEREGPNPFCFAVDIDETKFTNLTDVEVGTKVEGLVKSLTYEGTIELKSTGGSLDIPVIFTLNNPKRLLARLGLGRKEAWIGTKEMTLPNEPFSENGSSMVPLRFIIDLLPCDFEWDAESYTAKIVYQDTSFEIAIGEPECVINGVSKSITTPAVIRNGQTFIPLRLISEAFGAKIDWFGASRSILLDFPEPVWGREILVIEGIPEKAKVYMNFEEIGEAPLEVRHLKPGKYFIKVEMDEHETFETVVQIPQQEGKTSRVLYFLQRIIPTITVLNVDSEPKGAQVYVDGAPLSSTPAQLNIEPGKHRIRVLSYGYPDFVKDYVCLAGESVDVFANLEENKTKLSELVTPSSIRGEINLNNATKITEVITIKNVLEVEQSFDVVCPVSLPIGFSHIKILTPKGGETSITTPVIAPGESIDYTIEVAVDKWIEPGDSLSEIIQITSIDYPSWTSDVEIDVEATGITCDQLALSLAGKRQIEFDENLTVDFNIANACDVKSCVFKFTYQPSKLQLLDVKVGSFFDGNTKRIFSWHEDEGTISVFGPVILGQSKGVFGDGNLLQLVFKPKKDGDAIIDCAKSRVSNSLGEDLQHNTVSSIIVEILPEPEPPEDGEENPF